MSETEKPIPMIQVSPDFRRARYAEWCYSESFGKYFAVLACEELVEGRWEPFCSFIGCDGIYYKPFRTSDTFRVAIGKQGRRNEPIQ